MKISPGTEALFISGYANDILTSDGILSTGLSFISNAALPDEIVKKCMKP